MKMIQCDCGHDHVASRVTQTLAGTSCPGCFERMYHKSSSAKNAAFERRFEAIRAVEGTFYAILCPVKITVKDAVIYAGLEPVARFELRERGNEVWISYRKVRNPFWHDAGQPWVADAHFDLLRALVERAVDIGIDEALVADRVRWVGSPNQAAECRLFQKESYGFALIPPGFVPRCP